LGRRKVNARIVFIADLDYHFVHGIFLFVLPNVIVIIVDSTLGAGLLFVVFLQSRAEDLFICGSRRNINKVFVEFRQRRVNVFLVFCDVIFAVIVRAVGLILTAVMGGYCFRHGYLSLWLAVLSIIPQDCGNVNCFGRRSDGNSNSILLLAEPIGIFGKGDTPLHFPAALKRATDPQKQSKTALRCLALFLRVILPKDSLTF
jgi:hypothetical protein